MVKVILRRLPTSLNAPKSETYGLTKNLLNLLRYIYI